MYRIVISLFLFCSATTSLQAALPTPQGGQKIVAWRDEGSAEIRSLAVPYNRTLPHSHVETTMSSLRLTRPNTEYLLVRRNGLIMGNPYSLLAYREQAGGPIHVTGMLVKGMTATRVEATCTLAEYGPTLIAIMDIATK